VLEGLVDFVAKFWATLSDMAPYLLFGFFAAGLLSVFIPARLVERHLGGHGLWPVLKGALFGIPLPLCSCSVIPVTASLRKHGAGRGAASAFLISTPQTGVDSILVTFSLLGPVFTIFKPLAALVSGVFGGIIVDVLEPHGKADDQVIEECKDECCVSDGQRGRLARALSYGFVDLPRDIGKALVVGLLIAGAIGALVGPGDLKNVGTGIGAIVLMMLLGIPLYVCATASIPVALALINTGVSPGAALAFLMTGPATNAAGIATVWKVMGPRTAVVYLVTVASTALGAGLLLDHIFAVSAETVKPGMAAMIPEPVKWVCAVALLGVLAAAIFRRPPEEHPHAHEGDNCH